MTRTKEIELCLKDLKFELSWETGKLRFKDGRLIEGSMETVESLVLDINKYLKEGEVSKE